MRYLDKVFEIVRDTVSDQLGIEASKVELDSTFIDDLGADSLDIVELIMSLEEEFNMEIPDEDAEKIVSIRDVVNYVADNS
ncbi:MAG: acyl carrier protein [Clostridiales bacterium]|nr:acyl carrier protein [Clostridiales bacterium]